MRTISSSLDLSQATRKTDIYTERQTDRQTCWQTN